MTDSNHFRMKLLSAYHELIEATEVRFDEFLDGGRCGRFNLDEPAASPANFAAACEIISEIRLPRRSTMASVHAHAPIAGIGSVCLRAGATSSLAGREYLDRLASDSALALRLFDLFAQAARKLNIVVDVG